jgi:nucleoside-diphosphate-sugar epimerase
MSARGMALYRFDGDRPLDDPGVLAGATHLLTSAPPGDAGDPVLAHHAADIAALAALRWVGYLSATSVYGDTGGEAVDEAAPCLATAERGRRRIAAEAEWQALRRDRGVPVHVFRLAGIYGPGRSALDRVRAGAARRIDAPGHLFSRIHVDDIVSTLRASMERPDPGAIYNVCDNEPASSADVVAFACELLGVKPLPTVALDRAALGPMARSFYADRRRVRNDRIRTGLGVTLKYPDYRAGLAGILAEES